MKENANPYILGYLDWETRFRFWMGIGLSLILFSSLGMMALRPWDPYGAISLQLVSNEFLFLIRTIGLLLAVAIFASIIIDARLPLFGVFAACLGMAVPILHTAGMDYLMVRQQAGKTALEHPEALWGYLALETIAWSAILAVVIFGSVAVEQWLNKNNQPMPDEKAAPSRQKGYIWLRGLGGMVLTFLIALVLIALFAASTQKGQVVFAVLVGFFLAALAAEQIVENDHPIWNIVAVPLVAFAAYTYTWFHPDRPPGLESILHIAPNSLARVLPVEYIFLGAIGAIFGNWTSHRMRFTKENE